MLDYIHHQCEEALSEVRVKLELILNHGESAGTESLIDDRQFVMKLLSHLLDHG